MSDSLTKWIREHRPAKPARVAGTAMGWHQEWEPDGCSGTIPCRTYFLVGSECRFTCSMCDLWKYTLQDPRTPPGSISKQIQELNRSNNLESSSNRDGWIKLYNASNYFDPANIDTSEYSEIANQCEGFGRVIVENHASMLVSPKTQDLVRRFRDLLSCPLEVAMGLETIDPNGIKWLNKSMTLDHFQQAVDFLHGEGIYVRAFVLLQPLGTMEKEAVDWAVRTCQKAADWGVQRICLIPTRPGNGFVDSMATELGWNPPTACQLEDAFEVLIQERHRKAEAGRFASIFTVDLWDWNSMSGRCGRCSQRRFERLEQMNLSQKKVIDDDAKECSCAARSSN